MKGMAVVDNFMLGELLGDNMSDKRYTVAIRAASAGLYRIQVTDLRRPDPFAPRGHGTVVSEILANDLAVVKNMTLQLALCENPVACCRSLQRKYPCSFPCGVPVLPEVPS